MQLSTLGIDLAKSVFQLHGVNHAGKTVLKKRLSRAQFLPFLANLSPCLIGMEACSSSHYFARILTDYGHQVKLMPAQYVKPYVKTHKTDAADAEAICEAVTRPNMRFVAIKTAEQQSILMLHTEREGLVKDRTAHANSLRGMLAEFGFVMKQGISALREAAVSIAEDEDNGLPTALRRTIYRQLELLEQIKEKILEIERALTTWHASQADCQRVSQIPGVGLLTSTYIVAAVGDGRQFHSGKQLAAWIGLTPREHSSGGKPCLGGISKRGNVYLRKLLVHGARSVALIAKREDSAGPTSWLNHLLMRKTYNVAVVAQANKNARILWAVLRYKTDYRSPSVV